MVGTNVKNICDERGRDGGERADPELVILINGLVGGEWGAEEHTCLEEETIERRALLSNASSLTKIILRQLLMLQSQLNEVMLLLQWF